MAQMQQMAQMAQMGRLPQMAQMQAAYPTGQPAQMQQMQASSNAPAAAGGRYQGRIKSYNAEKGFGFIESEQARSAFGRDIFLHKAQIGDLKVGADVAFSVEA